MNVQFGKGLPHYQSAVAFQRGHGLGGLLGKLIKSIVPLVRQPVVRNTLKRLGKGALQSGLSAVHEKLDSPHTKLKDNLKKHVSKNLKQLLTSSPKTKTRKRKQVITRQGKRATLSIPRTTKRRKLDIFDFK